MKTTLRTVGALLALALLAGVMAYLAGFFSPTIRPAEAPRPSAGDGGRGSAVEAETVVLIEQAPGTIRAKSETVVSAQITARIAAVLVRAGDAAEAGDLLVQLDARALQARLQQQREAVAAAEAQLDEARSRYERVASLFRRGVVAQAEMDRTEADLRAAQAELAGAREAVSEAATQLSYTSIRSPIDGRVTDRFADPGDTATPGAPLLRLYDPASLRLEADVRESLATRLELGQALTVRVDALRQAFAVTVDEIVPSAEPGTRTFRVKVTLPAGAKAYPGMFGRLLIPTGQEQKLYVPAEAVYRVGQLEFVRVARGDASVRRYVRTGTVTGDGRIEILSGLAVDERVLLPGG